MNTQNQLTNKETSPLLWENPLSRSEACSDLLLIISPYITASAVAKLFEHGSLPPGLQIITKWDTASLLHGSSDPEVYKILSDNGGRLYLHPKIHLKLYIYSNREAVLSTGNLTMNGLGFSSSPNIEASSVVRLTQKDWKKLNALFSESTRVNDEVYDAAKEFVATHSTPKQLDRFIIPNEEEPTEEDFSWLSLPATKSPDALWRYYSTGEDHISEEMLARLSHDLEVYGVQDGLSEEMFHMQVNDSFLSHPFIVKLTNWLTERGEASFGEVKAWIQNNCSDRPTPWRKKLTPATQALFDWLAYYHPQITWDRPVHRQVMRWNNID